MYGGSRGIRVPWVCSGTLISDPEHPSQDGMRYRHAWMMCMTSLVWIARSPLVWPWRLRPADLPNLMDRLRAQLDGFGWKAGSAVQEPDVGMNTRALGANA